jgi:hypothetical protein
MNKQLVELLPLGAIVGIAAPHAVRLVVPSAIAATPIESAIDYTALATKEGANFVFSLEEFLESGVELSP